MFQRFTDRARRVLVLAQEEARLLNHSYIGTEHLLIGLFRDDGGIAGQALQELGIGLEAVHSEVGKILGTPDSAVSGLPAFTPRAKKVLELSLREALQLGHNYIGTEHMLLGLVREGEGVAAQVLIALGADLSQVRQKVIQILSGYKKPEAETAELSQDPYAEAAGVLGIPPSYMIWLELDEAFLLNFLETILGFAATTAQPWPQSHPATPLYNALVNNVGGDGGIVLSVAEAIGLLAWFTKLEAALPIRGEHFLRPFKGIATELERAIEAQAASVTESADSPPEP